MNGPLAGLVILAIGDSHMVYMASSLHDALEQQGARVDAYGMCGAMATDWLMPTTTQCSVERHDDGPALVKNQTTHSWLLADLIARDHPNLIVVELGDNMAGYGTMPSLPQDFIAAQVREFLAPLKARNLPCIWVGPPWGSDTPLYHKTDGRVNALSRFLAQIVAPCGYVDSTSFAGPGDWPTVDGEHLTEPAYHAWSVDITNAIGRLRGQLH